MTGSQGVYRSAICTEEDSMIVRLKAVYEPYERLRTSAKIAAEMLSRARAEATTEGEETLIQGALKVLLIGVEYADNTQEET